MNGNAMKRWSSVLSVAALVMGVFAVAAALVPQSATAAPPSGATAAYAALGDSYSSGEGLAAQAKGYLNDAAGNSATDGCRRAAKAYPKLVAKAVGVSLSFVACSGAVTGSHFDGTKNQGSLLFGSNGEARQTATLSAATKLMTVTIGGNDLGFVNLLTDCLRTSSYTLRTPRGPFVRPASREGK